MHAFQFVLFNLVEMKDTRYGTVGTNVTADIRLSVQIVPSVDTICHGRCLRNSQAWTGSYCFVYDELKYTEIPDSQFGNE